MNIETVVVAAGLSRRVGKWKPSLPFGNKTLIESTISPFLEFSERIIVVGGYNFKKLKEILRPYQNVDVVFNPYFDRDMFLSVKIGASCVKQERFFFTPGDYPLISSETLKAMLDAGAEVAIPTYKGRKGHPVLISSLLIPQLLEEPDGSSLKKFLSRVDVKLVEVDDEGIRLDFDTWEDYEKLVKFIKED